MYAVEFDAPVENGVVNIPAKYKRFTNRDNVRFIMMIDLDTVDNEKNGKFKELSDKTAGLLTHKNIDPLKWQDDIRREWDEREELLSRL